LKKFIIWAPSYSEKSGGTLVLHYLCHYLNRAGYEAALWHTGSLVKGGNSWSRICYYYLKALKRMIKGVKRTSPLLKTPLATNKDLDNAIVVYPETVSGNPLRAKHVVRWFLHNPGFHNERTDYGQNELYFYYQAAFNSDASCGRPAKEFFLNIMLEAFQQKNFGQRSGVCYVLRKGSNRPVYHDLKNGIIVDALSHDEMAKVFNESEYCISYDTQTFYSFYAALCGCKSIVIPEAGVEKEEWRPELQLRYGIAYGEDDLEWADNTRNEMIEYLIKGQLESDAKVREFAKSCLSFCEKE